MTIDYTSGTSSSSGGGGGGTNINQYDNVSAFPSTASSGDLAIAIAAEGVWLVNRKPAGLYRYNGTAWVRLGDINNAISSSLTNSRHRVINSDGSYIQKRRPNNTTYIQRLIGNLGHTTGDWDDRATLTYSTDNP